MVESELERSTRHETITSGEEVKTDDRLQNGGFTRTLGAEHCDTGQFDEFLHAHISQIILDPTNKESQLNQA